MTPVRLPLELLSLFLSDARMDKLCYDDFVKKRVLMEWTYTEMAGKRGRDM